MKAVTPYEELISAASSLVSTEIFEDTAIVSDEKTRLYLASNRQALEKARLALKQQCVVPLRNDAEFYSEHMQRLPDFRVLAKSFVLELHQARDVRRWSDAARIGVDLLTLGNAVRRGGLITDMLISLAFYAMGLEELRTLRTNFDEAVRKSLRRDLARTARAAEPLREIAKRDRQWEAAVGWAEQACDFNGPEYASLRDNLSEDQQIAWQVNQSFLELPRDIHHALHVMFDRKRIAMQRMLFVDLALRSYHAAAGEYPDRLAALAPAICRRVPGDPFAGEPFRYWRDTADAFVLYSVGPRQTDHQGQLGSWLDIMAGRADFCLDFDDWPLE